MPKCKKATAILTAGAPTAPLLAGALAAIYDRGKTFDRFFTSGAGGLVAATFLAPPEGHDASEALSWVVNVGVSDSLYRIFPMPFKVFTKPGPVAPLFESLGRRLHLQVQDKDRRYASDDLRRLYNDLIDLWSTALSPSTLKLFSKGLCQPLPSFGEFVDLHKLNKLQGKYFLNAYNLSKQRMENFKAADITDDHLQAATAFPFIYPPKEIGHDEYIEGATIDPINLPKLNDIKPAIKKKERLILFDVLRDYRPAFIRRPRNLIEAWSVEIFAPTVALAERILEGHSEEIDRPSGRKPRDLKVRVNKKPHTLKLIEFHIKERDYSTLMEWSHSSMVRLWQIGYKAGDDFVEKKGDLLPDRQPYSAMPKD
ncbi:MAG: patatin-like phospholipase family protein [Acidobacteriota bacterium]